MQSLLYRLCVLSLLVSGIGAMWEAFWWHEFITIELFGAPPHLLYHIPLPIALTAAIFHWVYYKKSAYKWIILGLLFAILSIPYGIWWHMHFDLSNRFNLSLYTSSHYLVFGLLHFVITILLAQQLPYEGLQKKTQTIIGTLLYAELLINALIRIRPFYPTGGVHALWGFWGVGVITFLLLGIFVFGQHAIRARWSATYIALWYILIYCFHWIIGWMTFYYFDQSITPITNMIFGGFRDSPFWITSLGILFVGMVLDATNNYATYRLFGIGFMYAAFVYGLGVLFIPIDFQYSFASSVIAMIAGGLGGACLSACVQFLRLYDE